MENEKKVRKTTAHRKTNNLNKRGINTSKENINRSTKVKKKKVKPMLIVDYTFLLSLVLSIIFGLQTNMNFFIPFVIVLVITIVCMGIILVNAIYSKIKKKMNKSKKEI